MSEGKTEGGKLLIFPGTRELQAGTDRTTPKVVNIEDYRQRRSNGEPQMPELAVFPGIIIPFLDDLYKEDKITKSGQPVSEILQLIEKDKDRDPEKYKVTMGMYQRSLFEARIIYIRQNVPYGATLGEQYYELAKHTWVKANDLGDPDLVQAVKSFITKAFEADTARQIQTTFDSMYEGLED